MALSSQTIQDKNALTTDAVFLLLLEINIPDTDTIYLVNNTEDITWNSNTYLHFPFEIDEIPETSSGETTQFEIKVANANRVMEKYLQDYDLYLKTNGIDGNSITCTLSVVNTKDIDNTEAILSVDGILGQAATTPQWATFTFTAKNINSKQFPNRKIFKNFCGFKFKDERCGYTGTGLVCDKTLTTCRAYNNSPRFGGFIGVAGRGVTIVS